jgi:hypothetical protein
MRATPSILSDPYQIRRRNRKLSAATGADIPTPDETAPVLRPLLPPFRGFPKLRCAARWTKPQAPRGYLDGNVPTENGIGLMRYRHYRVSLPLPPELANSWEWVGRIRLPAFAMPDEEIPPLDPIAFASPYFDVD